MFKQQVQESLQHFHRLNLANTISIHLKQLIVKQYPSAPCNIKEEQNNNARTPSNKPTTEQLHNEDSTSKHQNQCQTCRKSTPNCQNKHPIFKKYI